MFQSTNSGDSFVNTQTLNYVDQWAPFNNKLYI